jgi:UDPglucose 6-dehydrogenase
VTFHDDAYAPLEGADALVIVTEWDAFRALDLDRVKKLLKTPVIVDLRNVYRPGDVRKRGFTHVSVGRLCGAVRKQNSEPEDSRLPTEAYAVV